MSTGSIEWGTPPPPRSSAGAAPKYKGFLEALRERPGEWAKAPTEPASSQSAGNTAMAFRNGRVSGAAPGEFEAVSRTVDGVSGVWVRYVGGDA